MLLHLNYLLWVSYRVFRFQSIPTLLIYYTWKHLQDQAAATYCNKIRVLGQTIFPCLESRLAIVIIVRVTTATAFPLVIKVVFWTHHLTTLAVLPYSRQLYRDLAINLILPQSWPAVRSRREKSVSPTKEEHQLCRKWYFLIWSHLKCTRTRCGGLKSTFEILAYRLLWIHTVFTLHRLIFKHLCDAWLSQMMIGFGGFRSMVYKKKNFPEQRK